MKKLFAMFAVLFTVLLASPVFAGTPVTGGAFTNPAINTILADSGPLTDNTHEVTILVSSTVAAVVVLEYRNATDTANVWSQYVIIPANSFQPYKIEKFVITNLNERLRMRLNAAITGSIQASILID